MRKRGHIPIRTCIGCRRKRKKEEMIWLTQSPEGVVRVNQKKSHQGRGFYLCQDPECLALAKKRNRGVSFFGNDGFAASFGKRYF
jgi:predicted RNA-binding protein YlxR (DUF448 family)